MESVDTQIPEIILEGSGEVCIEGNSSLGMVEVNDSLEKVTVRATCSVLNNANGNALKKCVTDIENFGRHIDFYIIEQYNKVTDR